MDGSCYAFLFSAQDYPKTPLASTRLDSKKMQQVLSRRDFEVEEFPNVSGQQLTVEIEKIRALSSPTLPASSSTGVATVMETPFWPWTRRILMGRSSIGK